ncbi:hypothetical protein HDU87_004733 [Geranomyces variabilis]|uniref:RNase H type-1 domain-containing protein n=1 Tax=Geranomyces variabilis TaxID=109894 RepID=A0AAD5XMA6_9FUNG|nr:hypothetical protein HDU87_004733 [Geranomyces variabilis]
MTREMQHRPIRTLPGRAGFAALNLLHERPSIHGPVIPPRVEISKETLTRNPDLKAPDLSLFANLGPSKRKLFDQNNKLFELVSTDPFDRYARTFEHGTSSGGAPISVFTDGGYYSRQTYNGLDAHIATIGVYFPNDERMHRAEAVYATCSEEAEMLAVVRALEVIGSGPDTVVHVDCMTVIDNLLDDQATKWTSNIPMPSTPDLQCRPRQLLNRAVLNRLGKTTVCWVRSHDGNVNSGNSNADALCSFTQNRLVHTNVLRGLYLYRDVMARRNDLTGDERVFQFCEAMYKSPD